MSQGRAYIDGEISSLDEARVPLMDRGFLLGDGVFETLRVSNGRPFRPEAHHSRLVQGLKAIGLDAEVASSYDEALAALVTEGCRTFGGELYIRINVTTGVMEDMVYGEGISVTGMVRPFRPYPMKYYAQGIRVVLAQTRVDRRDPLAGVKTLSFLPYIHARRHALAQAAHDAVLRNETDRLVEASTSNLFARIGDTIHGPGPDEGALAGVTRDVVIEMLEDTGFAVGSTLTQEQLSTADEAWLTNTTGGVVPVTRFLDRPIGDGSRGELSGRLQNAYEDLVRSG